MTDCEIMNS